MLNKRGPKTEPCGAPNSNNLVVSASFRYKRKAKKKPETLQTRDQNLPK